MDKDRSVKKITLYEKNSPYELIDFWGHHFQLQKAKQDLRPTHTQQLLFDVYWSKGGKGF